MDDGSGGRSRGRSDLREPRRLDGRTPRGAATPPYCPTKISKGPELSNPVDPNSEPTGNTIFVLSEVYETPAGVEEHWRQAIESWQDLPAFMDWSDRVKIATLHSGMVVQGLW